MNNTSPIVSNGESVRSPPTRDGPVAVARAGTPRLTSGTPLGEQRVLEIVHGLAQLLAHAQNSIQELEGVSRPTGEAAGTSSLDELLTGSIQ